VGVSLRHRTPSVIPAHLVIPAKAGIQRFVLDSGSSLRSARNDGWGRDGGDSVVETLSEGIVGTHRLSRDNSMKLLVFEQVARVSEALDRFYGGGGDLRKVEKQDHRNDQSGRDYHSFGVVKDVAFVDFGKIASL